MEGSMNQAPNATVTIKLATHHLCSVITIEVSPDQPFWIRLYYATGVFLLPIFYLIGPWVCLFRKSGRFSWFPYYQTSLLGDYSLRKPKAGLDEAS